jgi:hypothetical protein
VVGRREARHGAADVLGVEGADVVHRIAQEAARQRAESDERDAEFAAETLKKMNNRGPMPRIDVAPILCRAREAWTTRQPPLAIGRNWPGL